MGRVTTYGTLGTEVGSLLLDRLYATGQKPAVLYAHGLNAQPWGPINNPMPGLERLSELGFAVSSHALGGVATWGNSASQTKMGDAKAYMQAAPVSAKAGPVLLYGGSMGTLTALNYTLANPSNVLAVAAILPAVSLQSLRDNAAYTASVEAAYGGNAGYLAALATHSPLVRAAEFASLGIPMKLWYSTDDTVVIPSTVTDFAAASGASLQSMGATAHTVPDRFGYESAEWLASHA